ncbi:MAG: hypothetical protein CVU44_20440 [Chloroflexi bacterium HGW-Chloroflexi-6]|nr:MAG: hypothetical protein CVU44_20440 [Chloroflexi bacterium HGW-Chloroflexi-6]
MKKLLASLFAVFILGLTGCQAKDERAFFELVDTEDINSSIRLIPAQLVSPESKLKPGKNLTIIVENTSGYDLFFMADTDVQIFVYEDGEWRSVKNNVEFYPSAETYISAAKGGVPEHGVIGVTPVLGEVKEKTEFRVLVVAMIMENGAPSGEKVAAYVDLWVEP